MSQSDQAKQFWRQVFQGDIKGVEKMIETSDFILPAHREDLKKRCQKIKAKERQYRKAITNKTKAIETAEQKKADSNLTDTLNSLT